MTGAEEGKVIYRLPSAGNQGGIKGPWSDSIVQQEGVNVQRSRRKERLGGLMEKGPNVWEAWEWHTSPGAGQVFVIRGEESSGRGAPKRRKQVGGQKDEIAEREGGTLIGGYRAPGRLPHVLACSTRLIDKEIGGDTTSVEGLGTLGGEIFSSSLLYTVQGQKGAQIKIPDRANIRGSD